MYISQLPDTFNLNVFEWNKQLYEWWIYFILSLKKPNEVRVLEPKLTKIEWEKEESIIKQSQTLRRAFIIHATLLSYILVSGRPPRGTAAFCFPGQAGSEVVVKVESTGRTRKRVCELTKDTWRNGVFEFLCLISSVRVMEVSLNCWKQLLKSFASW